MCSLTLKEFLEFNNSFQPKFILADRLFLSYVINYERSFISQLCHQLREIAYFSVVSPIANVL